MKAKLLISAVVLGMALPGVMPVVANAADTDPAATANKSASVEVTGGNLSFATDKTSSGIEAPSFQFKADVSSDSQTLKTTGYTDTKDTTDKYADSKLGVDDETGTGAGWHVTAQLGAFTGAKNTKQGLTGATLNMKTTTPQAGETAAADATTTDLVAGSDSATTIFNAEAGKGMGTAETDFAGSTLTLPTAAYADTYTADLTYNLTAGPTA